MERFYYNFIPELAVYSLHHYSAVALAAAVVVGGFADYCYPVFGSGFVVAAADSVGWGGFEVPVLPGCVAGFGAALVVDYLAWLGFVVGLGCLVHHPALAGCPAADLGCCAAAAGLACPVRFCLVAGFADCPVAGCLPGHFRPAGFLCGRRCVGCVVLYRFGGGCFFPMISD